MVVLFDVRTPLSLRIFHALMDLTQNYVASTLPLSTLLIAVWSHIWFEEVHLTVVSYRMV